MMKLWLDSLHANLLICISVAMWLIGIAAFDTFLGILLSLPLLIWASAIKFRVKHTVVITDNRKR